MPEELIALALLLISGGSLAVPFRLPIRVVRMTKTNSARWWQMTWDANTDAEFWHGQRGLNAATGGCNKQQEAKLSNYPGLGHTCCFRSTLERFRRICWSRFGEEAVHNEKYRSRLFRVLTKGRARSWFARSWPSTESDCSMQRGRARSDGTEATKRRPNVSRRSPR